MLCHNLLIACGNYLRILKKIQVIKKRDKQLFLENHILQKFVIEKKS